ncbi:MAG: alkaline phosphatase family protein [Phycisphaerae bacterium]|nr:alkaline phosphatase family protein [Phycisphaerae bacterium]NUQ45824.1 alkaline phosphatase family protein [Phycisphaerae bacterium]
MSEPHLLAYIGPGGGFAVVSSFFVVFITILIAIPSLLVFPFRWLWHWIRYAGVRRRRMTRRVVVLGLDGLDPNVMEQMIAAGELPHLASMTWRGRLATIAPPLSPVAWSSFATGTYPGSHRIFDFVHCNPRNYQPYLSSVEVRGASRAIRLGSIRIPLGGGTMKPLWKGEHFWDILGRHGVFSTVLRVPITFPAKAKRGHLLSGMCVPDLLGSQGISTLFTDAPARIDDEEEGRVVRIEVRDGAAICPLTGAADPYRVDERPMKVDLKLTLAGDRRSAVLQVGGRRVRLKLCRHSEWVPIDFKSVFGGVGGMCRFYLSQIEPHVKLYATPVHIDPAKPALPVSHPTTFGIFLAKLFGRYATLGIAEDTSAYENGAIDGPGMLEQCYLAHEEREKQFFHALRATREGLVVCVFDTPDRVQHMFWREHDAGDQTLRDMYRRMDDLVRRTRAAIDDDTVLLVMSDHGFNAFRRQVNINSFLREKGYIVRKAPAGGDGDGAGDDPTWLRGMDLSKTVAFGFGLAGIHINRKSFFAAGVLNDQNAAQLKKRLIADLEALVDPATGEKPIAKAQDAAEIYAGSPYADAAPDIIVGWRPGYRVSWESAKGQCMGPVFADNKRHWSGDHCFYPPLVPGVLLSSIPIESDAPRIVDVAPTVLRLLGVEAPPHMDGRPLVDTGAATGGSAAEPAVISPSKSAPEKKDEPVATHVG